MNELEIPSSDPGCGDACLGQTIHVILSPSFALHLSMSPRKQRLLYSGRDPFFKDMASLLAHVDFRMKLRCAYLNHSHGSETYLKRQQLLLWGNWGRDQGTVESVT